MNNVIRNKYWLSVLLVLFCSIPVIASAATRPSDSAERTATVSMGDLNLSEQQGVSTLFRRLQNAADEVCGSRNFFEAGSLKQRQQNQRCYAETLSKAVQEVGNAELSELHARSKRLP